MNVLVIAPYALWIPHLETDLEIIQRHLDSGDNVHVLVCSASLLTCDQNNDHKLGDCLRCIGRSKAGLSNLDAHVTVGRLVRLDKEDKYAVGRLQTEFKDISDLRRYEVDKFDIGMGVLSSLVSATRNPEPDLDDPQNKEQIKNQMLSSFAVYLSVRRYIRSEGIDVAYVFNGRMAILRGAFRAAMAEDVLCYTHDRGCDFNHYELYENSLPHNIARMEIRIKSAWNGANPADRESIGSQFFQERIKGVKQSWHSFTEQQIIGRLPPGWSDQTHNIVVFTSSEDEFVAVGEEWVNPLYTDQLSALRRIATDLAEADVRVYIRMHPNLKDINAAHVQESLSLRAPNLTVIPPGSDVDSYELLARADKVLTFGSTIGIEATFWGKPSILAGVCFYRNLGATYNPTSHKKLLDLLLTLSLEPKPKVNATIYGYYQKTRGHRFKYFDGLDVSDGVFKGKRIDTLPLYVALSSRIKRFESTLKTLSHYSIRKSLGT